MTARKAAAPPGVRRRAKSAAAPADTQTKGSRAGAVVAYGRVSKNDQDLALQLAAFKQFGAKHVFTDRLSGRRGDRPQLVKALDFLRAGDTLVVWKLDRLGRSTSQLVSLLVELQARSIHFVSIMQRIDTRTPMGKTIHHLMAAFAEMEADLIAERTAAGVVEARARGAVMGRLPIPPTTIQAIKTLMADPTLTAAAIATQLGIHRSTVFKYAHATHADIAASMDTHKKHQRYQTIKGLRPVAKPRKSP